MKDEKPYLLRGVQMAPTSSSILRSSSKYLNHPRLRDWIAMICLRRNGADYPSPAELPECFSILDELRDKERLETLFAIERRENEALNSWFNEGFVSSRKTIEDYAQYPGGSLGGIFYTQFKGKFEIEIEEWTQPKTQYDYYWLRHLQTHDFVHILTGGGFDAIGELVPSWFGINNLSRFISNRELFSELQTVHILAGLRITVRTMLHYPQVWDACSDAIRRGMDAGDHSDALFMKKFESALALPLHEARQFLGVRGVVDRDTAGVSAFWNEQADVVPPPRSSPWSTQQPN